MRDPKGQSRLTPTQKTATLQRRPSAVIAHGGCIVCGSVGARRASPSRTARCGNRHVRALRAGASAWEQGLPALPDRTGQAPPDPATAHLLTYAGLGGARHLFAPSHRMIRERQGSDHAATRCPAPRGSCGIRAEHSEEQGLPDPSARGSTLVEHGAAPSPETTACSAVRSQLTDGTARRGGRQRSPARCRHASRPDGSRPGRDTLRPRPYEPPQRAGPG